jgi:hypothetical protein
MGRFTWDGNLFDISLQYPDVDLIYLYSGPQ